MFCRSVVLCLLNCITKAIQVTEGRKYFPQGPHVAGGSRVVQPWLNVFDIIS